MPWSVGIVVAVVLTTTNLPVILGAQTACTCDAASTVPAGQCQLELTATGNIDNTQAPTGCDCNFERPFMWTIMQVNSEYIVSCAPVTTTTPPPKPPVGVTTPPKAVGTTPKPGGPTTPSGTGPPDPTATTPSDEEVRSTTPKPRSTCGGGGLSKSQSNVFKGLLYFGAIWVILWTGATIVVNLVLRSKGHHRIIGLLEEVGLIMLFIFLGFFFDNPVKSTSFCKITPVITHFFLLFVCGLALMESLFAKSLIKGSSTKNGSLPVFLNYIFPIALALIPALVSYFTLKSYYGANGHCFISVPSDMFWAFVIPAWILTVLAILFAQLSFLACRQASLDADDEQLFWAKKICKALPLFLIWLHSTFFVAAFAIDFQKLWLAIIFLILCLFFGPLIFILHTFCYLNPASKLWTKTKAPFYQPCAEEAEAPVIRPETPKEPEKAPERTPTPKPTATQKKPEVAKPATPQVPKENPRPSLPPPKPKKYSKDPTNSQKFYDWVTDRNMYNAGRSEEVLFKPLPS